MATTCTLLEARSEPELDHVRALFSEYAAWLDQHDPQGVDLCFQGFEQELGSLPGNYASPRGCLLLAVCDQTAAGCVGVRPLEAQTAELKRLFVRTQFLGQGVGKALLRAALKAAKRAGYQRLRLDTLPYMEAAIALYTHHGFHTIEPYYDSPIRGTIYMEAALA